jgi:hypothetical protein
VPSSLISTELRRVGVNFRLLRLNFVKGRYGYLLRVAQTAQTTQMMESRANDPDEYCLERIDRYQASNGKESLISMNLSPIKRR